MNTVKITDTVIFQTISDVVSPELEQGAIYNDEFTGFHEDYLVLHCLLRKYQPKSVFEIGTNMGTGTQIIKNALPEADVYSLDLPTELAHISLQHPISEGKKDAVGSHCKLPYTQLRGDSLYFDYSKYPCEAYFIDGEHDYKHVAVETTYAVNLRPKMIIWHDADIMDVSEGIITGWDFNPEYQLYRVLDTRIAYALKKQLNHD